jgi:flagella basal body P-ring formation protein FlgA
VIAAVLAVVPLVTANAAATGAPPGAPAPSASDADVIAAIVRAVHRRVGAGIHVVVGDLHVRGDLTGTDGLVALLDPSLRFGRRSRIVVKGLRGRGRSGRLAEADAVVRARAPHYEVITPLLRGDPVTPEAVRRVDGWLDGQPLKPLVEDLAGARTLRPLVPGDVLTNRDVAVPPTIRSGDPVRLRLATAHVEVSVEGVAAQDGRIGDRIRVVNPSSGRVLRGRVVGPNAVEVNHGS